MTRECEGCKECCMGWLTANIAGYSMSPGMPCHFIGATGCTIYQNRPEDPCKNYYCEWLVNEELPSWLKPSMSKVIVTKLNWSKGEYIKVKECGEKIDSSVLNWIYLYTQNNNINLAIEVGGSWYFSGPEGFAEEVS